MNNQEIADVLKAHREGLNQRNFGSSLSIPAYDAAINIIENLDKDYVKIPESGIGDLSDGYHSFNDLYYQRLVLTATIVKQNKSRCWKSFKHEDGQPCFGGGWFIVGIDTPEGTYTYHYEAKDFDLFLCQELPVAKHWDGHTDKDVARLLSLPGEDA